MELVVDTSAVIAVIAGEPEREAIIGRTKGATLAAPASLHWEVGNAFSAMFRRRRITLERAQEAIRSYERIVFRFMDVDLGRSLELSDRLELYAYDAYVLSCALTLRSPLITLDTKLAAAAPLVGVRVLELES